MPGTDTNAPIVEEGQPVIVRDLREEKRAEAELRLLQKERDARVAKLAHLDGAHADIIENSDGKVLLCRFCAATDQVHDLAIPHDSDAAVAVVDAVEPPPVLEDGEPTARQQRIEELRVKGRDSQLTAEEGAELLRLQAAEDQGLDADADVVRAATAFLVVVGFDGTAQATSDVNLMMELERLATVDDMDAGCAIVRRDIQASMTAKQVVFGLQVSAQAMAEKQAAVRAMDQVQAAGGVNLGGRRRR